MTARSTSSDWGNRAVRTAVRYLDRVIDINYYPTDAARALE